MRIAVSSWSFRAPLNAGELRLSQVPAACTVLGFEFVELNDSFLRPRGRTGRILSAFARSDQTPRLPDLSPFNLGLLERGLRTANAQLICFAADSPLNAENPETLPEQVRYVKAVIGAARYLNCNMVRLWLAQSNARVTNVDPSMVEAFRDVTETATRASVRLALEPRFGRLEELEALVYIVEQVRSYYLGASLNFSHLPAHAWRVGLNRLAPYSIHVHAPSREFDADGNETTIPYPACMAALKRVGYKGFISIEYEGTDDPLDGIITTRSLIERCLTLES